MSKRKRGPEELTPLEKEIKRTRLLQTRVADALEVHVFPQSLIRPEKSDYDKARKRLSDLVVCVHFKLVSQLF